MCLQVMVVEYEVGQVWNIKIKNLRKWINMFLNMVNSLVISKTYAKSKGIPERICTQQQL
jgi:hypothetical protein